MFFKSIMGMACVCLLIATDTNPAHAVSYIITDLGTLGGSSYGYGINDSGQVAGHSDLNNNDGTYHAFAYDGNSMRDLGTVEGGNSVGYDINNSGQVTGWSSYDGSSRVFYYDGSTMQDVGRGVGFGINDSGYITGVMPGTAHNSTGNAFIYDGNTMQNLGTLGGIDSRGHAINSSGQITGYSNFSDNSNAHAIFYDGSTMHDLGTLGGRSSLGFGLNDSGQVVGWSYINDNSALHAFIYDGSMMQDLGTLGGNHSRGNGINNSGQVVGWSNNASGRTRAFLYEEDNGMQDLCEIVNCVDAGWDYLVEANAINDNGDITGFGIIDGQARAFLVSAVPIPAAFWLFGSGLLGLLGFARRKK